MKKLLRVVVIACVLSLALIAVKNEYACRLLAKAQYGMPAVIAEADAYADDAEDKGIDLFVGSSMFRQGLDIYGIEDRLEERSYILSYNGNEPALEYMELEYLLEHGVKIHHVYMDMYTGSMLDEPWVSDEQLFLQTDTSFKWEVWDLIKDHAKGTDFWEMFVGSGNDLLLSWPLYNSVANISFYRGGNISQNVTVNSEFQANTSDAQKGTEPEAIEGLTASTSFNEKQVSYIHKMAELCRENGVALTFIETPKYISYGSSTEYAAMIYRFAQILEEEKIPYYLSESSAVVLSDTQSFDYLQGTVPFDTSERSCYIDYIHLSPSGRTAYTASLMDVLTKEAQADD